MQSFPLPLPSTCLPDPQLYLKTKTKPRILWEEDGQGKFTFCLHITFRMCFSGLSGFGVMTLKIICRCTPAQNIFALFLSLFLSVRNKAGGRGGCIACGWFPGKSWPHLHLGAQGEKKVRVDRVHLFSIDFSFFFKARKQVLVY